MKETSTNKIHYIVYKITNIRNNMIYVGVHETDNLNDGYMGSGQYIKIAIQKEGIQNFKREILFDYDNCDEMIKKESEIVTPDFVKDPNTYNLIEGGKISTFQSEFFDLKKLKNIKKITSEKNQSTYVWIMNPKLQVKRQLPKWIELPQDLIDEGWEYGQGKKGMFNILDHNNQSKTLYDWSKELNVSLSLLIWRYNNWDKNDVLSIPLEWGKEKESPIEIKKKLKKKKQIEKTEQQKKNYMLANEMLNELDSMGIEKFKLKHGQDFKSCLNFLRKYSPTYRAKYMKKSTHPVFITCNGMTMSISKWMRTLGIKSNFAFFDLKKLGMSNEEAIQHLINKQKEKQV